MHLGFIGLGNLGSAIAKRFIDCGYTLTVWNRTPEKAESINAEPAESLAGVAKNSDIIFLCLFDSRAVHHVLTMENGLLAGDISGKIIVDFSTNHFRDVMGFHDLCTKAGVSYLEVPVLGSVVPALQGTVTLLISGEKERFEQVRPILNNLGKHLIFLEKPSLATKMKLINNLTLGSFMATIAEALALGESSGLEKEKILDILSVGGGDSLVLNVKRAKLLAEDFSVHFSNALIYKDLHCLQDLAYEQKKTLFTGSVVKELYARTFEQGIDQEDFSAVYKLFKQ